MRFNMFYPSASTSYPAKHTANRAAIFRLCVDMIEKPNGDIAVLEIGANPSSSFSGYDRHQPKWTKRQEAMRDIMQFANSHDLPIFLVGSENLLLDEVKEEVRQTAGLYWEGHNMQQQFYPTDKIDDLISHIEKIPAKNFSPENLTSYRCIVICLTHIKSDMLDALPDMHGIDVLVKLRSIPDVILVDDKKDVYYDEIYDSKVITNTLLPAEFAPKTLILSRKYEPDLARKIITHFKPATKILIKPAHGSRGLGIIILSLNNEREVDQQLRDLLDPETIYQKNRHAISQLNINKEKNAEHYWMESTPIHEPVIILQEFIASKPVIINEQTYQAVTRFVFTVIHNNGQINILFHGNPYQKIASAPINAADEIAASISRVHDDKGPEPIIMTNRIEITELERQLTQCFQVFFQNALQYGSKQQIFSDFFTSGNAGLQTYAALESLEHVDLTPEVAAQIQTVIINQPNLLHTFYNKVSTLETIKDDTSQFYRLTKELLHHDLISAIHAKYPQYGVRKNYYKLLGTVLLPQIESLWQQSNLQQKYYLFILLVNCTDYIRNDYDPIDFPSDTAKLSILNKLKELIYCNNQEVVIATLIWCAENEKGIMCSNNHYTCTIHPLHNELGKVLNEYEKNPEINVLLKSYLTFSRQFGGFRSTTIIIESLSLNPEQAIEKIIECSNIITAAYQQGISTQILRVQIKEIYARIFILMREIFEKWSSHAIINNPTALGIYLCIRWMFQKKSGENTEQSDITWLYQSAPFSMWINYASSQHAIISAWNFALNTLLVSTEHDTGIDRSLNYIESVLMQNRFELFHPQKDLINYQRIYNYLLTLPHDPVVKAILNYFDSKTLTEVEATKKLADDTELAQSVNFIQKKGLIATLSVSSAPVVPAVASNSQHDDLVPAAAPNKAAAKSVDEVAATSSPSLNM